MERVDVSIRVDSNGTNAHLLRRLDDSAGNLASVGDQDLREVGGGLREGEEGEERSNQANGRRQRDKNDEGEGSRCRGKRKKRKRKKRKKRKKKKMREDEKMEGRRSRGDSQGWMLPYRREGHRQRRRRKAGAQQRIAHSIGEAFSDGSSRHTPLTLTT